MTLVDDSSDISQLRKRSVPIILNSNNLKRVLGDETSAHNYFNHDLEGEGKSYLASRQLVRTGGISNVSEDDVNLHSLLSLLLLRISKGERILLSKVSSLIVDEHVKEMNPISTMDICVTAPIPFSDSELRQCMEGDYSMSNNVPCPTMRLCPDGNACVLPSEVLKFYFGCGIKPHMICTAEETKSVNGIVSNVWQTKHAKDELNKLLPKDDSTNKLLLVTWSDSFDPNVWE